jgi:hypothetical protein
MVQIGINFERSTCSGKFEYGLEGRRAWFIIFHVKMTKKVTSLSILRMKKSFLGLQNLEAKEIV